MSDRKAVIKNADMGEEMQQDAVDCATQALEKYNIEKVRVLVDWRRMVKRGRWRSCRKYVSITSPARWTQFAAVISSQNATQTREFHLQTIIVQGQVTAAVPSQGRECVRPDLALVWVTAMPRCVCMCMWERPTMKMARR